MQVCINLDDSLAKELESVAKELNVKTSKLVEEAISYYFDKLDEKIADKRLDDLKNGESSVVELEEVLKKAGIDVWSCFRKKSGKRVFEFR